MALGKDWMARTLADKVAMAQNIKGKIGNYEADLELTPAEVAEVEAFCNALITAYNHKVAVESGKQATDTWFDNVLYGTPSGAASPNSIVLPVQGAIPGLVLGWVAKMRDYRRDWVVAAGYTTEIGEDLMIVASGDDDLGDVTPILNATAAQSGYAVVISVTNRGEADFCIPQMRRKGGSWEPMQPGFTGRTREYIITPTTEGDPETVEIRLQLMRKNENYGLLSQTAAVTVVP